MFDSYPCRVQQGNKNSEQQNKKQLIAVGAHTNLCIVYNN